MKVMYHKNAGSEETPLEKILSRLGGVRETKSKDPKKSHIALCPAHDDRKPSLSLGTGADGRALVKCFTGCEYEEIMRTIGLTKRDGFPEGVRGAGRHTATYEIRDRGGVLRAFKRRYDYENGEKTTPWYQPDGKTKGLNGTPVKRMPLYGSERVADWPDEDLVVLVEGEKAKDALKEAGIHALATVTGASVVPEPEVFAVLAGREVCLWPDNDDEGRRHMQGVAERLHGLAREIRWYEWGAAPPKGDAADHPYLAEARKELASAPVWEPGDAGPDTPGRPRIETISASSVKPEEVEWLWDKRSPYGKLTIFDGDPDQGKSVVTMDIAARVSRGRGFPDGATCDVGNVAIANVEDGVADTIVPRLMAHGADLERIEIINGIPGSDGNTRILDIPGDVPMLEQLVESRNIKLLIVDPVLTMLGGDANKDQDARKALTPLRDMAERTGCAVIAVRHLNKSVGLKAIQRGGGNMGLIGVARAGAFFATDPEDEKRRIMAQHKSNLAEKAPSLLYRIVGAEVVHEGVSIQNVARIEWLGTSEYDANGLAADGNTPHERSELEDAKEFLREELSAGPMWAKQVFRDAEEAGVAKITLRRAKTQLKVKSEKIGVEGWQWELPAKGDHDHDHLTAHDHVVPLEHLEHLPINKGNTARNTNYKAEDDHDAQGDHPHEYEPLTLEGDYVANSNKKPSSDPPPSVGEPTTEKALELLELPDPATFLDQWRNAPPKEMSTRFSQVIASVAKEAGHGADWRPWCEPVAEAVEKLEPEEGR